MHSYIHTYIHTYKIKLYIHRFMHDSTPPAKALGNYDNDNMTADILYCAIMILHMVVGGIRTAHGA